MVGGPKNLYFCPRSGLKMPINQGTKLNIKVEKVEQYDHYLTQFKKKYFLKKYGAIIEDWLPLHQKDNLL